MPSDKKIDLFLIWDLLLLGLGAVVGTIGVLLVVIVVVVNAESLNVIGVLIINGSIVSAAWLLLLLWLISQVFSLLDLITLVWVNLTPIASLLVLFFFLYVYEYIVGTL